MEHAYFSIPPRSVGTLARKNLTAKRSAIHGAPSSAATPSPTASTLLPSTAWDTRLQRKGGPASNSGAAHSFAILRESSSPKLPPTAKKSYTAKWISRTWKTFAAIGRSCAIAESTPTPGSNNVSSTKNLETSSPHRPLHGRKFADVARLSYARRMGTACSYMDRLGSL